MSGHLATSLGPELNLRTKIGTETVSRCDPFNELERHGGKVTTRPRPSLTERSRSTVYKFFKPLTNIWYPSNFHQYYPINVVLLVVSIFTSEVKLSPLDYKVVERGGRFTQSIPIP